MTKDLVQSPLFIGVVALTLIAATMLLGPGAALLVTEVAIMALFATSLGFLINYGDMVSFGHAAYFGLGAYGFALTAAKLGLPLWIALILGPLTALLGAVIFGALCVRLSHIYLAMLTLACSEIVFTVLFQAYDYTGGDNGITNFMKPRFGLTAQTYAAICIGILAVFIAFLGACRCLPARPRDPGRRRRAASGCRVGLQPAHGAADGLCHCGRYRRRCRHDLRRVSRQRIS